MFSPVQSKYILLLSQIGEERVGIFKRRKSTQICRGEIFVALPRQKQPEDPEQISLTGITKKEQRLVCSRSWVEYLSDDKAKRLEAIASPEMRYNAFVRQQSHDVEVVKIRLNIKTLHTGGRQGELRLACSVSTETGEMVGEEQWLDKVSILLASFHLHFSNQLVSCEMGCHGSLI